MNIVLCKLVTGEEVLGELVAENDEKLILKNPVQVATVKDTRGNPSVGFAPFPTFHEEKEGRTIDLLQIHIVYSYIPADDFRKNYEQVFGVGLILPGQQQIITG